MAAVSKSVQQEGPTQDGRGLGPGALGGAVPQDIPDGSPET